jgi:hypothetical protein
MPTSTEAFAPRGRRERFVTTRLDDDEFLLLIARARQDGCSYSDVVRRALREFLRAESERYAPAERGRA